VGRRGERGWAARANGPAGARTSSAASALGLGEGYATWAESGHGMGGKRGRHSWAMRARAQEGEEGEGGLARGFELLFLALFYYSYSYLYSRKSYKNK
jgi:hypothetical protein